MRPVVFWAILAAGVHSAAAAPSAPSLLVDLTYAVYQGYLNATSGLNVWKGIRYAAPPIGSLRWQTTQPPPVNRTTVQATTFGPSCPQSFPSVGAAGFVVGNEDCLYLNVYAPANASNLPVFVYIHGGGYGLGDASMDVTPFASSTGYSFVSVIIQYRLGAFGFLSSPEVNSRGVLNAGLLDQAFALKWIQTHISKFGGDPSRVTIGGESAGAGSVVLHAMAEGGTPNTTLFSNIIASSPWFPQQWNFDDEWPVNRYNNFVTTAGCAAAASKFDCLVSKDTLTLQWASNSVSTSQIYGTWSFVPVTGGSYVRSAPSKQLWSKKIVGQRLLVSTNANEGAYLVPSNIKTLDDLTNWLQRFYPSLNDDDINDILHAYPSTSAPVNPLDPKFATPGYGPATAVNVSQIGTGQQQRAYNIYAETILICPSYWMSSAFTGNGRSSYHYQYSVPLAAHGDDLPAYFGPAAPQLGPDFTQALRSIWGNFITANNPSIPVAIANGASSPNPTASNAVSNWPAWTAGPNPSLINVNQSGGVPYLTTHGSGFQVWQYANPGLRNNFTLVDATSFEGGRGQRCEFWKTLASKIPV